MGGAAEQPEDSSPRTDWLFAEMFKYCVEKRALKAPRSPLKRKLNFDVAENDETQQRLLKRPTVASQHSASPDGDQRP